MTLLDFSKIEGRQTGTGPRPTSLCGVALGDTPANAGHEGTQEGTGTGQSTCSPTCPTPLVGDAGPPASGVAQSGRQRHQVH